MSGPANISTEPREDAAPAYGPVIVWETSDLLIGRLRRVFDRAGVQPSRVATARECVKALHTAPTAAVVIEASAETIRDVLFGLYCLQTAFPHAAAFVALHRGSEGYEATLREWGVVDVVRSLRRLEPLAGAALRHAMSQTPVGRRAAAVHPAARPAGWFDDA